MRPRPAVFVLLAAVLLLGGCDGCPSSSRLGDATEAAAPASEATRTQDVSGRGSEGRAPVPERVWQATAEERARWIEAACAEGCDETLRRRVAHLARAARLEPTEAGIRVTGLQAYSPWVVCGIDNGDLVVSPTGHGALLRACATKKGPLVVRRRGEEKTVLP